MVDPFYPSRDMLEQFLSMTPCTHKERKYTNFKLVVHGAGMIEVIPDHVSSRQIIISAGIHGNETAPIELLNQLVTDIADEKVEVKNHCLFLLGNALSMVEKTRFVTHNMNRLFSGRHKQEGIQQNYETERAAELEAVVDQFFGQSDDTEKLHLDMHTAIRLSFKERFAIYPFSEKRQLDDFGLSVLAASGVRTLLVMETSGPTFSSYSGLKWGAQSYTVELGRVADFGENDLPAYSNVFETMSDLVSNIPVKGTSQCVEQLRVSQEIKHTGGDFELNIAEDGLNFTQYTQGDWVWRGEGKEFRVSGESQYLVFPNTQVSEGERAGLLVEKIKK